MSRRPTSAQGAATATTPRTFTVAVVGLSVEPLAGSTNEFEKSVVGAGKSCLCNRLVRPLEDDYYTDHISELSQSDFGGRVVNNDHFLYWGETGSSTVDEQDGHVPAATTFRIIEHTEFIDDASFRPFRSGVAEPYHRRCAATKLQSAEKLAYICKNQLGLEHEFEQTLLPEGRANIDGFVCVLDVAVTSGRQMAQQVDYTALLLTTLLRTKRPVVLATTKNDQASEASCREAERLIGRKEFRNCVPLVETSAKENVNVGLAFLTLAHLIDRTRTRPKMCPYSDAAQLRHDQLTTIRAAYESRISALVTDHRTLWIPAHRDLRREPAYVRFVARCGTHAARTVFSAHVAKLRCMFISARRDVYIERLRQLLPALLPNLDVVADRSWPSVVRWLERQEYFSQLFAMMPDDLAWHETDFAEGDDPRVPFDLLLEGTFAETCYRNHVNALRAEQKRLELMQELEQLLEERASLRGVVAGQALREVDIFLAGRNCFAALSPEDRQAVYDGHQMALRQRATDDFCELLLEHADLFVRVVPSTGRTDLDLINARLAVDNRYHALDRLNDEREAMILSHAAFMKQPSPDRCPFLENCADLMLPMVLESKVSSKERWRAEHLRKTEDIDPHINLTVLGQQGLAQQFMHEVQMDCADDEYSMDGQIFTLNYIPIDGDTGFFQNDCLDSKADGCLFVYNSVPTLDYLCTTADRLLSQPSHCPLVAAVVLASDPFMPSCGLARLRDGGRMLATRLRCPYVDVTGSAGSTDGRRFSPHQVELALQAVVSYRRIAVEYDGDKMTAPDIRILTCFMCGDDFDPTLPLGPLLNDPCCHLSDTATSLAGVGGVSSTPPPGAITLEVHLDETGRRRVELVTCSYHTAPVMTRAALYHGLILVYSATRCAALRTLAAFASIAPKVPMRIVAVTESGGASAFFSSEHAQNLLVEGNAIADRIRASYTTTSINFHQQTASYTPFFRECWDRRQFSESSFYQTLDDTTQLAAAPSSDTMANRPPATLPRPTRKSEPFGVTALKDSTSNSASHSTEDSEPLYDRPHFVAPCHSDSDASSMSSPHTFGRHQMAPRHNGEVDADVYCEIPEPAIPSTHHPHHQTPGIEQEDDSLTGLYGANRRHVYSAVYRKSLPSISQSSVSSSQCRDESPVDTDSGSVQSQPVRRSCHQPHYQFRKSNSMRLALKETVEGTMPGTSSDQNSSALPPALPKPNITKPKDLLQRLDAMKFAEVRDVLSRNMQQSTVRAPLATPEPVELSDYAQVRDSPEDAVCPPGVQENDYALVADALPEGQVRRIRCLLREPSRDTAKGGSDSDSERSSLERDTPDRQSIYSRVQRRPTPHKKKYRTRPAEGSSVSPGSQGESSGGVRQRRLPLPPLPVDRQFLIHADQLEQGISNSEGSEGTGDDSNRHATRKHKKRSLRSKKKSSPDGATAHFSPTCSDSDLTGIAVENLSVDQDTGNEDYMGRGEFSSSGRVEDDTEELLAGANWKKRFGLRASEKDMEKQRRKEEKRKMKEEEKKQKEVQKQARKAQKKGSTRGALCGTPPTLPPPNLEALSSAQGDVPGFIVECVRCIEGGGLDTEGLYRVPGNRMHVDMLMERWREEPDMDIALFDVPVNAVATALKQFLIELSDSVIPSFLHSQLMDVSEIENADKRREAIRDVLQERMPKCHMKLLKFLVHHFHRVSEHSSENSMDCRNLAICWWPTLIRPSVTSFETIELVRKFAEQIVYDLIVNVHFYFVECSVITDNET